MFHADRNVRPCTILGYTLTTFPKKLNTDKRNTNKRTRTNSTELRAEGPCTSVRNWTPEPRAPTVPTGTPEHRKNHFDEVQARFGTTTHQEDICVI